MSLRSGTKFKDNFHRNDFVTNGTRPAPRNNSVISNELVGAKRRSLGKTDPELKNEPEKVSRKREFQSHGKNPPAGNSTNVRGNSENEIKGRGSAHAHAHGRAHPDSKSERTSYSNKPHAKTRENESSDSDSDDKKR